jgi:hypothetical protein
MKYFRLFFILVLIVACEPSRPDLRKDIDGWEKITTIKVIYRKTIQLRGNDSKIIAGKNNLIRIELEKRPIYKPGHFVTDIHTFRSILIEIAPLDTLITPQSLGNSKIYREIIALSPEYGTRKLKEDEKITVTRTDENHWQIMADLYDFQFEGRVGFSDSLIFSSKDIWKY